MRFNKRSSNSIYHIIFIQQMEAYPITILFIVFISTIIWGCRLSLFPTRTNRQSSLKQLMLQILHLTHSQYACETHHAFWFLAGDLSSMFSLS